MNMLNLSFTCQYLPMLAYSTAKNDLRYHLTHMILKFYEKLLSPWVLWLWFQTS